MTLTILAGLWLSACVQTQTSLKQGWVKDSYEITLEGKFTYLRRWYKNASCTKPDGTEKEVGELKILSKFTGGIVPDFNTYEVDFVTSRGLDKGAMSLNESALKIARGQIGSKFRSTMLSLFEFRKK